jgi:hypothetical protein
MLHNKISQNFNTHVGRCLKLYRFPTCEFYLNNKLIILFFSLFVICCALFASKSAFSIK